MNKPATTDHAADPHAQALLSIILVCVGYLAYSISDAIVKEVAGSYHFSQVMFFTRLFILAFIVPFALFKWGVPAFRVREWRWFLLAGGMGTATTIFNIIALPHIQMTTFYTLVFTSPLWVAVLSAVFLKEKIGREKLFVICAGFAAVLFVFQPGVGQLNVAALLCLASALAYSASLIVIRHVAAKETRTVMICSGSTVGVCLGALIMPFHYTPAPLGDIGLFLAVGGLGAVGTASIYYAFQIAPTASTVAPFHYTQLIWGALLGYFFFAETPDHRTMTGAAVIVGAGLYLIFHTRKQRRKKPQAA